MDIIMEGHNPPARRKTTIEIPLPSIRKYVPGSGPPPPKISLLPPSDSTGYIIDQFVLPTDKEMTPDSRRLIHYHIGFTDLPAAKLLVPCHKVLDYISPRELEDWEYRNAERLAEEKKATQLALREKQMAKKKAAAAAAIAECKRPVDRPPKVKPNESQSPNPTSPANETLSLVQQVAGPSLATPKMRKISMVLETEHTASDLESDEAAIQRQLHADFVDDEVEQLYDAEQEGQWVGTSEAETVDQLVPPPFEPLGAKTSRANSLASSRRSVLPPFSQPALPGRKETPVYPPKPKQASISPPMLGGNIHPAFAAAFREQKAGTKNGAGDSRTSKSTPAKSYTTQQSKISSPTHQPEPLKIAQWTPAAVGRGRLGQSAEPSSATPASKDQAQEVESKKEKKGSKSRKRKAPLLQEEVWDFKELLDDQWIIENGTQVHKYLVLWVGEWPAGQNPTWEPAENIQDKSLIRQYHEKKVSGSVKPPSKKMQKTLHHYLTGKQYTSVAEAFEDGLDVAEPTSYHANDEDMDMDKEEFLVAAVDNLHPQYAKSFHTKKEKEGGSTKSNGKVGGFSASKSGPSLSAFDTSHARYQQSDRGAPR
ncbi:hypothetical protein QBC36DRAFT_332783 [Triangularia setosa]|uniref:Chromo domain-containing protein n=1 Tax=Triangularia setosa TaxID=2587417 RepID=A0AAN7A683_9PEZI|nr:hypothetical protein QBC36DRAFT_332783 [Podospora setosa]